MSRSPPLSVSHIILFANLGYLLLLFEDREEFCPRFLLDNKPEESKAAYACYEGRADHDADNCACAQSVLILIRIIGSVIRVVRRIVRIIGSGTHLIFASIALAIRITVCMSRLVCLVTTLALVPMLVLIAFPGSTVVVNMKGSKSITFLPLVKNYPKAIVSIERTPVSRS